MHDWVQDLQTLLLARLMHLAPEQSPKADDAWPSFTIHAPCTSQT